MIEQNYLQGRQIASNEPIPTDEMARRLGFNPDELFPKEEPPKPQTIDVKGELNAPISGAVKGAAKTVENAVNLIPDAGDAIMKGLDSFDGWLQGKGYTAQDFISSDYRFPRASFVPKNLQRNEQLGYAIGQTLSQVASFGTVAAARGLKQGVAIGGAVAAAVQDPNGPRLSNFLKDTPLVGPFAELLASKPDDSQIEGRIKNAVEAMTLDTGLAGAAVLTMRGMAKLKAVPAEAAGAEQLVKAEPIVGDGAPKQIGVEIPADYKSPLAGQNPDELLTKIRDMKAQGPEQILSNVDPATAAGSASVDAQLAAQQGGQASLNQQARSRAGTTVDQTLIKAAEIHKNPEQLKGLLERPAGSAYNAEEVTALGFEVEASADRLTKAAEAIVNAKTNNQEITQDMLSHYKQMSDYFPYVREVFEGSMSESGRALNIKNYVFGTDVNKQTIAEYINLHGGNSNIEDQAGMIMGIVANKGPQGIQDVAKEMQRSATWGQAVQEVYIQNLLSPMSAIKIATSNITQQALGILERHIAPSYARARGATVLADQMEFAAIQSRKAAFQSAIAEVTGGLQTFAESMGTFAKEAFSGSPVRAFDKLSRQATQKFRYDYRSNPAMSSEALGVENRLGATLVDLWGSSSRMSAAPISIADRFADAGSFKMQGTYLANLKGMEKGLAGAELQSYVDDVLKEFPTKPEIPTARTPEAMTVYADQLGKYQEYSQIWDGINQYRDQVKFQGTPDTGWGKYIYEAVNNSDLNVGGVPILKAVSPFIRNNVNMSQAAMDSIPFVRGWSPRNKEILSNGGIEADLLMSRFKVMNTLMALGAAGGLSGFMSGQESLNPDVKSTEKAMGNRPYSFGNEATFRNLGTAGVVMSIGSDLGVLGQYYKTGIVDNKWNTDFLDAVTFIGASVSDKLVVDDVVADFWSGMKEANLKDLRNSAPALAQNMAVTAALPAAGTLRFMRNQTDQYQRVTKGSGDLAGVQGIIMDLMNRVPGLSSNLPKALDVMGYPIEHKNGFVRTVTDFDDALVSKNKTLKGLLDLGMAGVLVNPNPEAGETSMAIHPMPRSIQFRGSPEQIPLNPQQYQDLVLMSLGKEKPMSKGDVEGKIDIILSNKKPDEVKRIQIKKIISGYRQAAKGQLLQKYPDLMEKYRELLTQRRDVFSGTSSDFLEE